LKPFPACNPDPLFKGPSLCSVRDGFGQHIAVRVHYAMSDKNLSRRCLLAVISVIQLIPNRHHSAVQRDAAIEPFGPGKTQDIGTEIRRRRTP